MDDIALTDKKASTYKDRKEVFAFRWMQSEGPCRDVRRPSRIVE